MVGKVERDSTFPIIQTVCCRSPQTPGTHVSICLQRGADLSAIASQTDRRPLQIIWKPGLRSPTATSTTLGTFRAEEEDNYVYEFSVLSTRTSKNIDLQTLCACPVGKTRSRLNRLCPPI